MTTRYAVFVASPWHINPLAVLTGGQSRWDAMHLDGNMPTYFVLAPRDGGRIRIVETDPFFMRHSLHQTPVSVPSLPARAFHKAWRVHHYSSAWR